MAILGAFVAHIKAGTVQQALHYLDCGVEVFVRCSVWPGGHCFASRGLDFVDIVQVLE